MQDSKKIIPILDNVYFPKLSQCPIKEINQVIGVQGKLSQVELRSLAHVYEHASTEERGMVDYDTDLDHMIFNLKIGPADLQRCPALTGVEEVWVAISMKGD